jgi:uncharacterized protein YjgD (DUF1641 family)
MARPIVLDRPLRNLHEEAIADLQDAPEKHAEALLELMEVLEGLHQAGVLTVARGMLAAGDKLVESAVDALDSPQVIRGMRNLMALAKAFSALDPAVVQSLAGAIAETTREAASAEEPPNLLSLMAQLRSQDVRRGLGFATRFMASLGRQLRDPRQEQKKSPGNASLRGTR